jgi:predicted AAA+ superfamily ATPase
LDRTGKSGRIVPLLVLDEIHKAKKWKQTLKGVYDTMDVPAGILVTASNQLNRAEFLKYFWLNSTSDN